MRCSFRRITEALNSMLEDVAGYLDFSAICSADITLGYDHLAPRYDHLDPLSVLKSRETDDCYEINT